MNVLRLHDRVQRRGDPCLHGTVVALDVQTPTLRMVRVEWDGYGDTEGRRYLHSYGDLERA